MEPNNGPILSPNQIDKFYRELLEHPDLVYELSPYHLSKIKEHANSVCKDIHSDACKLVTANPNWLYPPECISRITYWMQTFPDYTEAKTVLGIIENTRKAPQPISQPQEPTPTAASEQNGKADQPPTSAIFVKEARDEIYKALLPYVDEAERPALNELLAGKSIAAKIQVNTRAKTFCTIFKIAHNTGKVNREKRKLNDWLCRWFNCLDKNDQLAPLNPKTVKEYLKGADTPE
ncbi:hypothetical protein GCM10023187_48510 [Nibrella viscosa]|uniref:Uncharacterized protein n=1 Tax=Nibrella viscosa TaxID=1084524 RepID=A0ABP8KVL2_9BACT